MGWLARLLGGRQRRHATHRGGRPAAPASRGDEQALERYRYLVRTAPPAALEEMHREAFARMTPEQRARALHELNAALPPGERLRHHDPAGLARLATRAEMMRPGTVVTALGGARGLGMGGFFAGSLLSSLVGTVVGSMVAHELLEGFHGDSLHGDAFGGHDGGWQDPAPGGVDDASLDEGGTGWDDAGGGFDGGADWGADAFGTDEL